MFCLALPTTGERTFDPPLLSPRSAAGKLLVGGSISSTATESGKASTLAALLWAGQAKKTLRNR